jgi:hypothetical protein
VTAYDSSSGRLRRRRGAAARVLHVLQRLRVGEPKRSTPRSLRTCWSQQWWDQAATSRRVPEKHFETGEWPLGPRHTGPREAAFHPQRYGNEYDHRSRSRYRDLIKLMEAERTGERPLRDAVRSLARRLDGRGWQFEADQGVVPSSPGGGRSRLGNGSPLETCSMIAFHSLPRASRE